MKNQVEKTETAKTKQFSVIVGKLEVLNTSDSKEVDAKISELQKEFSPLIILIDNKKKSSTRYSKTIHQRNYRKEAGNFEIDSVTKQNVGVEQTQE